MVKKFFEGDYWSSPESESGQDFPQGQLTSYSPEFWRGVMMTKFNRRAPDEDFVTLHQLENELTLQPLEVSSKKISRRNEFINKYKLLVPATYGELSMALDGLASRVRRSDPVKNPLKLYYQLEAAKDYRANALGGKNTLGKIYFSESGQLPNGYKIRSNQKVMNELALFDMQLQWLKAGEWPKQFKDGELSAEINLTIDKNTQRLRRTCRDDALVYLWKLGLESRNYGVMFWGDQLAQVNGSPELAAIIQSLHKIMEDYKATEADMAPDENYL